MARAPGIAENIVHVGVIVAACVACVACSRATKTDDARPPPPIADAVAPPSSAPALGSAITDSVPLAAPSLATSSSRAPVAYVDVDAWLKAHGAPAPSGPEAQQLMGCTAFRVTATPPREGLLCTGGGPPMKGSLPTGESLFPLTVWLLEGQKLRLALEAPIAAGPLDREAPPAAGDVNQGMYIHLDAAVDASGNALEIRERPGAECAQILASLARDHLSSQRKVVEIACRARGRYFLRNGSFGRAAP